MRTYTASLLLLSALSVTIGACTLPQPNGLSSGRETASVPFAQDTETVPITGPHVWPDGRQAFDTATYSVADEYESILRFPGSAARRVDYCYHRTWNDLLYRRECIALDYMVHRDQRFHSRARLAAQDPYFQQSAYLARMAHDIPWAGFQDVDALVEFQEFAWRYVEPKTINRLHLQDLHYLDGPNG